MSGTRRGTPKKVRKVQRDWGEKFLTALASTGVVSYAAKLAKVPRRTAYNRREAEPDFRARWDDALEQSTEFLEREAVRRAAEGTLRPVYQSGELVGKIREYSDTLLIFLLKGRKPSTYRDNFRLEHSGPDGKPIPIAVLGPGQSMDAL